MPLVTVEPACAGLLPVAGLGVDHADDPVGRHPLGDDEAAIGGLLDVLADHRGQQLGGPGDLGAKLVATQGVQGTVAVAEQRIHQPLAGRLVVPVADRLARGGVVVVTPQR
jgi:hypothetical protein